MKFYSVVGRACRIINFVLDPVRGFVRIGLDVRPPAETVQCMTDAPGGTHLSHRTQTFEILQISCNKIQQYSMHYCNHAATHSAFPFRGSIIAHWVNQWNKPLLVPAGNHSTCCKFEILRGKIRPVDLVGFATHLSQFAFNMAWIVLAS